MAEQRPKDQPPRHYRAPPKGSLSEDEVALGGGRSAESVGSALLDCAYNNELKSAARLIKQFAPIDFVDGQTGLTSLHIAVGRDHLEMAKLLIENGASFLPDKQGRTPSVIAAECEVSDEMCDFIAEAEAKAEGV